MKKIFITLMSIIIVIGMLTLVISDDSNQSIEQGYPLSELENNSSLNNNSINNVDLSIKTETKNEKGFEKIKPINVFNEYNLKGLDNEKIIDKEVMDTLYESDEVRVIIKLRDIESISEWKEKVNVMNSDKKNELKSNMREQVIQKITNKKVKNRYNFMNGFSAKINKEELDLLIKDSLVERISYDRPVHVNLQDSVPLINATSVWNISYNGVSLTGKGQSVCLIDTGVNYSHLDLGGCTLGSGIVEDYSLTSPDFPSNYPDSYDNTWTITKPGYSMISVYFDNFTLEYNPSLWTDYVDIMDGDDKVYARYEGNTSVYSIDGTNYISGWNLGTGPFWSMNIPGDTIKIKFHSDGDTNYQGFNITKVKNVTDWSGCGRVIGGFDFYNYDNDPMDDNGHGTHCAGIIGANGTLKGVAPEVNIIAVKALDHDGSGYDSDIMAGIDYCNKISDDYNISVISMSLGGDINYDNYCDAGTYYSDVINQSYAKNISVIVAAGNSHNYTAISSPACIKKAIPVTATKKDDTIDTSYANRNWMVQLAAPGTSINSTFYTGEYAIESGTSMATPHVAGAFAIMNQYLKKSNINNTPWQIETIFNLTGKKIYDSSYSNLNYSRINLLSAIIYADNISPTVNLTLPENNSINSDINKSFFCNLSDDVGLANVTLFIWNSTGGLYYNETKFIDKNYNYTYFNVTDINIGTYSWNCLAYDKHGNNASAIFNFSFEVSQCSETIEYFLTPYVMAWNSTAQIIRFETYVPTNVTISYGTSLSYGNNITEDFSFKHEIVLDNLSSNTKYYYKIIVTNESGGYCYQNTTFASNFLTNSNSKTSFKFAIIGDDEGDNCGELGSDFPILMNYIKNRNVDFVIMTGDLIQAASGGCTDYNSYWQGFHNITNNLSNNISLLSVIGNDEDPQYSNSRIAWRNFWILPMNGNGSPDEWDEATYMWSYGNSLFIALNTEEVGNLGNITGDQFKWFNETALRQQGYNHKFVFAHRPLVGSDRSGNLLQIDSSWSQIMDDLMYNNNVTMAIYGHDHYYCYNTTNNDKMINLVIGTGGALLDSTSTCKGEFAFNDTHAYAIVTINGNEMTTNLYNITDELVHTFSKTANDITSPNVIINTPKNITYSSNSYVINITLNEEGYCEYSLNNGITNNTMNSTDNITFLTTKTSVANGNYKINAYCRDVAGNRNDAESVSFVINKPTSTGGGGGGGGGGKPRELLNKNVTEVYIAENFIAYSNNQSNQPKNQQSKVEVKNTLTPPPTDIPQKPTNNTGASTPSLSDINTSVIVWVASITFVLLIVIIAIVLFF